MKAHGTTGDTSRSGTALRRGLRLYDPVVSVAPGRGRVRHAPTPTVHEAFSGTAALHPAITLARTVAISALLAMSSTSALSGSRGLASRASVALSLTALATPDVTYAIGVADAVSATAVMTTFQAKGHSSRQRTP